MVSFFSSTAENIFAFKCYRVENSINFCVCWRSLESSIKVLPFWEYFETETLMQTRSHFVCFDRRLRSVLETKVDFFSCSEWKYLHNRIVGYRKGFSYLFIRKLMQWKLLFYELTINGYVFSIFALWSILHASLRGIHARGRLLILVFYEVFTAKFF